MKTSYTVEEWANYGLLEHVPVHRVGAVVNALNYTLVWIESILSTGVDDVLNCGTILPIIAMTITTVIDVSDSELNEILGEAYIQFDDYIITNRKFHNSEINVEAEFEREFCEKAIKKHYNRLQLN